MNANSAPNSMPAARPGTSVPSRPTSAMPRERAQGSTRTVATAERIDACSTSGTVGAASLIATCCMPHTAVSAIIVPAARASSGRRTGEGGGVSGMAVGGTRAVAPDPSALQDSRYRPPVGRRRRRTAVGAPSAGPRPAVAGGRLAPEGGRFAADGGRFAPEDGSFASLGGRLAPEDGSFASRGGRLAPDGGRLPSRCAYAVPEGGRFASLGGRFDPEAGRFPVADFRSPDAAGSLAPARRRRGAPAGGGESANGPRRGRGASSRNADSPGAWRAAPRRCFEVCAPTSCGGRCRPAPPDGAPRDSRRRPGDFAGFSRRRGSGSGFGAGRQRIRILPRCCTGAASRLSQIPARCASRSSRSSECTRTLTSSCAPSATSISCSTVGESPAWPIATTGWSGCARARSSRRCDGVSVIMRRV